MKGLTCADSGRRTCFALASLSLLFFSGCTEQSLPGAAPAGITVRNLRPLERHDGEALSVPARLRAGLPPDALAYVRVPSLWGLVSTPKGSSLDATLASRPHVEMIAALREVLPRGVLGPELLDAPVLAQVLEHQRGPLELAVLPANEGGPPWPVMVLATTLDIDSIEDANELLEALLAGNPQFALQRGLSQERPAMAVIGPAVGFADFDPATGWLRIAAGLGLTEHFFTATLQRFGSTSEHPMHGLEARIDASGQAAFAWINVAQVVQAGDIASRQVARLQQYGLADLSALAIGFGVSEGKGRASLLLEMPETGLRRLMWSAANDLRLEAAGEPELVTMFSLPDAADIERMAATAGELFGVNEEIEELRRGFRDAFGVSLEDLFAVFGPELLYFEDAAGDFLALKVRDVARQRELIETIVEHSGLVYERRDIRGRTHHHMVLPSLVDESDEEQAPESPWLALYSRLATHLYWIEDSDYLILADIPQPLLDRQHIVERVVLADWLGRQRLRFEHSLLAGTVATRDLPRTVYYAYLAGLNSAGDAVHQPLDLYALPTALEAGLPEVGSYAFQLDAGEQVLGLTLTYENNPAEILAAGNALSGVAVAGILAAIAIPAYQDYTVRAQVSEGLALAAGVKVAVAEHYATAGRLPRHGAELGLDGVELAGRYTAAIEVVNGAIVITYGNEAQVVLQGSKLTLTPWLAADGRLVWSCGNAAPGPGLRPLSDGAPPTDVLNQHLPSACREGFQVISATVDSAE
jgi:Tfp pilus assembly major pilin PilA